MLKGIHMFVALSIMIKQLFAGFTRLFSAFDHAAGALEHGAKWAEDAMGSTADTAAIERQVAKFKAVSEAKNQAKLLGITLDVNGEIKDTPVKSIKAIA